MRSEVPSEAREGTNPTHIHRKSGLTFACAPSTTVTSAPCSPLSSPEPVYRDSHTSETVRARFLSAPPGGAAATYSSDDSLSAVGSSGRSRWKAQVARGGSSPRKSSELSSSSELEEEGEE